MTDLGARVGTAIRDAWDVELTGLTPYGRGMNSRTWLAEAGDRRWVAKAVALAAQSRFVAGLAVAAIVDAAGIPAGAPEPTIDGRQWIHVGGLVVALLRFVDGTPLIGDRCVRAAPDRLDPRASAPRSGWCRSA